jgi:molecular chaperone GrpE
MEGNDRKERRPIRVTDRRGISKPQSHAEGVEIQPPREDSTVVSGEDIGASDAPVQEPDPAAEETAETVPLDDFLRLQADFDNRRKRLMRETAMASDRAKREMLERLLPLLDNFDRALEHDDGSSGLQLLHKELLRTLESEGLEEIEAAGQRFDPHVHDAVESHPNPDVEDTMVKAVYRKGYRMGDLVLRPAMVVVEHPENNESSDEATDAEAEG